MIICKIIAVVCFAVAILYSGAFLEILLNPNEFFGSNATVIQVFAIVMVSTLAGLFFLTRGEQGHRKVRIVWCVSVVAMLLYGICLIGVLFGALDMSRVNHTSIDYSLIPFRTIREFWHAYRTGALSNEIIVRNLIGNIVLFMPMSWFLPILFEPLRNKWLYALTLLCGICLVEVVQHISYRGVMDVDDVILNFAGAMVVFLFIWNRRGIGFLTEHDIIEDSLF